MTGGNRQETTNNMRLRHLPDADDARLFVDAARASSSRCAHDRRSDHGGTHARIVALKASLINQRIQTSTPFDHVFIYRGCGFVRNLTHAPVSLRAFCRCCHRFATSVCGAGRSRLYMHSSRSAAHLQSTTLLYYLGFSERTGDLISCAQACKHETRRLTHYHPSLHAVIKWRVLRPLERPRRDSPRINLNQRANFLESHTKMDKKQHQANMLSRLVFVFAGPVHTQRRSALAVLCKAPVASTATRSPHGSHLFAHTES